MSGPLKDVKVSIEKKPHAPFGKHVDIITPLSGIRGVDKMRIDENENILTEDILIKGGLKKNIFDNTK